MRNSEAVIAGVWRALRPRDGLWRSSGGHGCVAKIKKALVGALNRRGLDGEARSPGTFRRRRILGAAEQSWLLNIHNCAHSTSYAAPGDVTGWLETFGESFTAACRQRSALPTSLKCVRPCVRARDAEGKWTADYVRLRFAAIKQV